MKIIVVLLLITFNYLGFAHEKILTFTKNEVNMVQQLNFKSATKNYTLVFFFAKMCSFCHKFIPVVEALQTDYNFELLTYSFESEAIGNLPEPKPINQNIINDYFKGIPIAFPLLAVQHKNGKINILSPGFTQKDIVLQNFEKVVQKRKKEARDF